MRTEPGSASACTRAATFGASPNTSPAASTTTRPKKLKTYSRRQLRRTFGEVPGVEVGKRSLDRERRPHGALGIVLLRLRVAEERHEAVAELL